ncbi:Protein of unknown function [Pyronema omphalodes CBS 100304]|uniref:Uncharacterized protein n=1 Tax=Pyronema omphalodes (strain CBS 100304) TaxID=1076935 RepID=U4LRE3_PYROM|nr:Protein of unknown function [Pyronema omphalodes CBS 100304]
MTILEFRSTIFGILMNGTPESEPILKSLKSCATRAAKICEMGLEVVVKRINDIWNTWCGPTCKLMERASVHRIRSKVIILLSNYTLVFQGNYGEQIGLAYI